MNTTLLHGLTRRCQDLVERGAWIRSASTLTRFLSSIQTVFKLVVNRA
jgi:hypothetical protein